jgi:hypothetical protein
LKWLSETGRPRFPLGSSRDSNEKTTCISLLPLHSTCPVHPKLFGMTTLITQARGINYEAPHPIYPSWMTTPFWPSKTAYFINFKLPSISRVPLFHRQPQNATCLGGGGLLRMPYIFPEDKAAGASSWILTCIWRWD